MNNIIQQQHNIGDKSVNVVETQNNWMMNHSSSGVLQVPKSDAPNIDLALDFYTSKILCHSGLES